MANLDCANIINLIPLYIDNELTEEESRTVREHIAACPRCRQECEMMQSIVRKTKNLPRMDVPEGFHARLMQQIQSEEVQKRKIALPWRNAMGLVAAAAVVAVSVVSYLNLDRTTETPNPDVYLSETAPSAEGQKKEQQASLPVPQSSESQGQTLQKKDAVKAKESEEKTSHTTVLAEEQGRALSISQESAPDVPAPASEKLPEGRAVAGNEIASETAEPETFCVATVTVDETAYREAEEILSGYEKDSQGYAVGQDYSLVLERLSSLLGYGVEISADCGVQGNYIILK